MFLKYSIMFFERGALYMLLLTKSILSLMIGFIASVIVGLILIPSLKRINFGQRISEYVGESHRKKEGTPTMGGIIFIIPTVIGITYLVMSGKLQMTYNLGIVLIVFVPRHNTSAHSRPVCTIPSTFNNFVVDLYLALSIDEIHSQFSGQ